MSGFVHLDVASAFSPHYGVNRPDVLAAAAAADGQPALACTDRDGLYGVVKHLKACRENGIAAIFGVNLAVLADGGAATAGGGRRRAPGKPGGEVEGRVTVLAHGHDGGAGYSALCQLVSAAHAGDGRVGVTRDQIARAAGEQGVLTVLVGPESDVGRASLSRDGVRQRALLQRWIRCLPAGSVAVEAVTHLNAPGAYLSTSHAARMVRAGRAAGVSTVLTNAVRYAGPDGAATADVLDAVRALTPLRDLGQVSAPGTPGGWQPNGQGWLKDGSAMEQIARDVAYAAGDGAEAAADLLRDTEAVAAACMLDPAGDTGWGMPVVPEAGVIGITGAPDRELALRCEAGIDRLYGREAAVVAGSAAEARLRERLGTELDVISDLGYASYFLTVAEVSKMITRLGVRNAARGSGASSLVNYLVGISHVDPLRHDLVFERFLSRNRTTLPDIDIDVESAERHRVYREIFARFGSERVTLMSMQNAYRARGAVRDAGLALGMEADGLDDIAKQLWRFSASNFREALAEKPELARLSEQVSSHRQLDLLVDLTERLDRLPRHISMHPCGVILSDTSLLRRTPVQPSGLELPMSQFDKHDMDPMGMLKLDVLGVRMQSAMAHAVSEVRRIHGSGEQAAAAGDYLQDRRAPDFVQADGTIELERIPFDDESTFELIRSTHTLGCFQIESPGQRELIGKLAPREFNDLIIDISLFRPGPMQSNMVKPYLENRHGFAPEVYPHPDLREALAETHGVTVFHEQILRILNVMTGCDYAEADVFRRLLGSTTHEPRVEAYFREHAAGRGYSPAVVDEVWQTLQAFGSFGFCKAHGAAFAVPTYQSAWLKTHHPEAFLAGLWEHDPGMYPKRLLVSEARRLGIPILPMDVNASDTSYRVERCDDGTLGIRLALTGVYGVSSREVARLRSGQPYSTLSDVRERSGLKRASLERFAALGAFDSLQDGRGNRADLVLHFQRRPVRALPASRRPFPGQQPLPLPDLEREMLQTGASAPSRDESVRTELDLLAVDVSGHLMDSHAPLLRRLGTTPASELLGLRNGTEVLVAGVRVATQTPPMRGGRRVVFISVDDGTGCVDCTFFHEAQQRSGPFLFGTRLLLMHGITRRTGPRGISVQALQAWDLADTASLPGPGHLASADRARNAPRQQGGTASGNGVPQRLDVHTEAEGLDNRVAPK
ncbi:DNA polymerase III subunit alpha [Zhihengliuella salsuginis]|uniref:DNA-directed DNA polymerase n=1 Tax=Zhihengliuella salsuginis TaxID=578222 RepID=A0ABQ3GCW8_9MICC|nr:DNA polymerase III subunit alpha [Zhihengliuella salsuginis]GHD01982.1 DNA-directed DNA polymerase [Zhihengliuella salsuginis]